MFSTKLSVVPATAPFAAALLACVALLSACSSTAVKDPTAAWSPNKIYAEARDEANSGAYDKAIPLFEKLEGRAAGTPLETYGVSLDEAKRGEVARAPAELPPGSAR